MQRFHWPPSSWHSKRTVPSEEEKVKVAEVELTLALGPLSIVVPAATVSTVHVLVAGLWSTFPAPSIARTEKVCAPSASPVYDFGDVQAPHDPVSSLHSKWAPPSADEKVNEASFEATGPVGPPPMVVSGAIVSTVHARVAGVWSTFPAPSTARTPNVCAPSASPVYDFGESQAVQAPPSRLHSKSAPASGEEKANDAALVVASAFGPLVTVVSGATVSTVQVRVAGDGSRFPLPSTARTAKVCVPWLRPEYAFGEVQSPHVPPSSLHSK